MHVKPFDISWVVLFGGAGREAVVTRLHASGVRIGCILAPRRRSNRLDRAVEALRSGGLPVIDTSRLEFADQLSARRDCGLLSLGFPYLLPDELIRRHPIALNVHPTLLPRYRGATTGAYIIQNNEAETGSTVHLIHKEMDRGPVVVQSRVPLSRFDTLRSMQRKVYEAEPGLVLDALNRLDKSEPLVEQNEAEATEFPRKRTPEDSRIDPDQSLLSLVDQIRACDPDEFPAFFYLEGQKICVRIWRPEKPEGEEDML